MLPPNREACLADKGQSKGPEALAREAQAIATVKLMKANQPASKGGLGLVL